MTQFDTTRIASSRIFPWNEKVLLQGTSREKTEYFRSLIKNLTETYKTIAATLNKTIVYVSPGGNLAAAIRDIPADGGIIRLGAGTHNMSDWELTNTELIINKPGLTIIGEGEGTLINKDVVTSGDYAIMRIQANNVMLKDFLVTTNTTLNDRPNGFLRIDSGYDYITVDNIKVLNSDVSSGSGAGSYATVYGINTEHSQVSNCLFFLGDKDGISIAGSGSHYNLINNNRLIRNQDTFFTTVDVQSLLGQKVLSVTATTGMTVGRRVWINPGGGAEETGTIASIDPGVSITLVDNLTNTQNIGNTVEVTGIFPIQLFNNTTHNLILGNRIQKGPHTRGITLAASTNVGDIPEHNIVAENMIIGNNNAEQQYGGIGIEGGKRNTIIGNIITDINPVGTTYAGIFIRNSGTNIGEQNLIIGNNIHYIDKGIAIEADSIRNSIEGNIILGCDVGIRFAKSSTGSKHNTCKGNKLYGCTTDYEFADGESRENTIEDVGAFGIDGTLAAPHRVAKRYMATDYVVFNGASTTSRTIGPPTNFFSEIIGGFVTPIKRGSILPNPTVHGMVDNITSPTTIVVTLATGDGTGIAGTDEYGFIVEIFGYGQTA
jgi:hypothetical protein